LIRKKHGVTKTNKSEKIVSKEKPPKEMKQKKQNNTPDKITPKLNNKKNDSKTQKIKTTELHTKQKRKIETVTESVSHKKQKLEQEILEKEYNLHNEESESDELSSGDVKDDMASESADELIGNEDSDFSELQKNLQQKMIGARFRWLNEQLYTTSGKDSFKMFKENPNLFQVYHDGFRSQVESWSINPVEFFIAELKELPKKLIVADFGCGEAVLAKSVPQTVHSFDLVAVNENVVACDMSRVPLSSKSVDIAIYCLSLMGTNITDYLKEAYRVLRVGGTLKIAEVSSRIINEAIFIKSLTDLGFDLIKQQEISKMFIIIDLKKSNRIPQQNVKVSLKPCVYKKR